MLPLTLKPGGQEPVLCEECRSVVSCYSPPPPLTVSLGLSEAQV
jgi:hypothetical protein